MKDIYIILKDRFQSDFDFYTKEVQDLLQLESESGLNVFETEKLWKLKGKLEYAGRQISFFQELIEYYK